MISPPSLKKGDTIAIISTARKISMVELEKSVQMFNNWGLNVLFAPNLFQENNQFAGTEQQRISDIHWAFQNEKVKAIICARGGYGTTRLIDDIDFNLLKSNPKWICGFSDVTALLCSIFNLGIQSVHSTMPVFFSGKTSEESIQSLKNILFGNQINYKTSVNKYNLFGTASGVLIGGNLSMLAHIIGTKSDVDWKDKILFIEDLDEYLYHIDRMMVQLKRTMKLQNLKGIIVGSMSGMHDNKIPFGKNVNEIIIEHTESLNIPIAFDFPAGHDFENHAIKIGSTVELTVEPKFVHFKYV